MVTSILITAHLECALRRIRRDDTTLVLWVDAICIDRQDPRDRSFQVGLISEIYQLASSTYAWVGLQDSTTNEAMEFIRKLNTADSNGIVRDRGLESKWRALTDLMCRPVFSRRWAFQELAFAQDIRIRVGRRELRWSRFCEAISVADTMLGKVGYVVLTSLALHVILDSNASADITFPITVSRI